MGYWATNYWAAAHWRPDYWRDFGVTAFRLYDAASGTLVRVLGGGTPYEFDLSGVFDAGTWTLGLTRVDAYGSESTMATLTIVIDGGGAVAQELVVPSLVRARPLSGGGVELRWISANTTDQLEPTEFEIADQSDLGTVLDTIDAGGERSFAVTLSSFADAATVRLAVRASDGASARGEWVLADAVVADATGPPTPDVIP